MTFLPTHTVDNLVHSFGVDCSNAQITLFLANRLIFNPRKIKPLISTS